MLNGVIFACVFAALWIAGITLADYRRQRRLRTERRGFSEEDFVRHFSKAGVADAVSQTVYRGLQREKLAKAVPALPTDDLCAVHRIDNEELDELTAGFAAALGKDFRRERSFGGGPINTVDDLVKYLDSLPTLVRTSVTDV